MRRKLEMQLDGLLVGDVVRKAGEQVEVEEPHAGELVQSGAAKYTDDPAAENVVPIRRAAVETTVGRTRAERAVSREDEQKEKEKGGRP
jgi:hypothetical protein